MSTPTIVQHHYYCCHHHQEDEKTETVYDDTMAYHHTSDEKNDTYFESKYEEDKEDAKNEEDRCYFMGDRVMVRSRLHHGGKRMGQIVGINRNLTYRIEFDDGGYETHVPHRLLLGLEQEFRPSLKQETLHSDPSMCLMM